MYDELVKRLREATEKSVCGECGLNLCTGATKKGVLFAEAADAIEARDKAAKEWEILAESWRKACKGLESKMPHWIPIKEQSPKAYEEVLLHFPHNQAAGFIDRDGCWAVYSGDGFYTEVADNEPKPTHWANKLPEPPKEEV